MRAIGRLFAASIGFILAVVAAALFLLAAAVGVEPSDPADAAWFWGQFAVYGAITASYVGAAVFIPWAVAAMITEIFSIRSVFVHVGGGGILGMGTSLLSRSPGTGPPAQDLTLLLAAGFVGGLVYWLVAGRMAGTGPVSGAIPPPRPPAGSS
jgi:hypothetical protein